MKKLGSLIWLRSLIWNLVFSYLFGFLICFYCLLNSFIKSSFFSVGVTPGFLICLFWAPYLYFDLRITLGMNFGVGIMLWVKIKLYNFLWKFHVRGEIFTLGEAPSRPGRNLSPPRSVGWKLCCCFFLVFSFLLHLLTSPPPPPPLVLELLPLQIKFFMSINESWS